MSFAVPLAVMRILAGLCLHSHAVRAVLKSKAVVCHQLVPIPTVDFPERNKHGRGL